MPKLPQPPPVPPLAPIPPVPPIHLHHLHLSAPPHATNHRTESDDPYADGIIIFM